MSDKTDKEILELLHTWAKSLVPEQAVLFDQVAELEPEIRPLVTDHIRYYDELLPSLLMGDIARWTIQMAHQSSDPETRLRPFFDRLEQAWGDGQNAVADLIATSFVEYIFDEPAVVRLLGPKLNRYYRIYTGRERAHTDEKRPMPEAVRKVLKRLGRM